MMTKITQRMAAVSATLVLCVGGALAQTKPADKSPQPSASKSAAPKPSVSAKPTTSAATASAKNTSSKPAAATSAKPAVAKTPTAKPAVQATTVSAKPTAQAKPVTAKPSQQKPVVPKASAQKTAPPKNSPAKPVSGAKAASATGQAAPATPVAEDNAPKRDPFVALVNNRTDSSGALLPPGKAGLVVATVRVDGTVRSGTDLVAVVSNPSRHVYFVREGDQLYDGSVEKIDLDGVTFHENSKDAFGKPVVRTVTKRIYASAGERQ